MAETAQPTLSRPTAPPPEPTFSTKQAARRLGLSTATVYKLCEQGKLRHARDYLNAIRITESAMKEYESAKLATKQRPISP
jgi:excisionase family DNA binding protein